MLRRTLQGMQDFTDEERRAVFGELIMDELRIIREYLSDIPIIKRDVAELKIRAGSLESDMKVVKAVLIEHERDIAWLKTKVA